jgi:phage gpG-like protein
MASRSWAEAPQVYRDLSRRTSSVILASAKTAAVYGEARIKERLSGVVLRYRKGNLRRSVTSEIIPRRDDIEIVFRAGSEKVPYPRIHEEGGIIKAKKKPYLIFKGKDGWVAVKQVTMPRRPYMTPSALEALVVLRRSIVQGLEDMR